MSTWALGDSAPLCSLLTPTLRTQGQTSLTSKDVGNRPCSIAWTLPPSSTTLSLLLSRRGRQPHTSTQSENSLLPAHMPLPHASGCLGLELSGDAQSGPQGLASLGEGPTCTGTPFLPTLESSPPRREVRPREGKHQVSRQVLRSLELGLLCL